MVGGGRKGKSGGGGGKVKGKDGSGGSGGGNKGGVGGGCSGGGEVLLFLSFNLLNLFVVAKSTPGGPGTFFTRSPPPPPSSYFMSPLSSHSRDPTIGFSTSKNDISSKTISSGFCLLKILFFIGSSFCLKLALLILSFVT